MLLKLLHDPVGDAQIEVVATKMIIAGGINNLEHAVACLDHGKVEGSASQVKDDQECRQLIHVSVGKRGGGRLIQNAEYVKSGYLSRIPGRLTLTAIKVSGHRDNDVV